MNKPTSARIDNDLTPDGRPTLDMETLREKAAEDAGALAVLTTINQVTRARTLGAARVEDEALTAARPSSTADWAAFVQDYDLSALEARYGVRLSSPLAVLYSTPLPPRATFDSGVSSNGRGYETKH